MTEYIMPGNERKNDWLLAHVDYVVNIPLMTGHFLKNTLLYILQVKNMIYYFTNDFSDEWKCKRFLHFCLFLWSDNRLSRNPNFSIQNLILTDDWGNKNNSMLLK